MPAVRTPAGIQGLARELMSAAGDRQKADVAQAERYFLRIAELDYASHLLKRFDRCQMRELMRDLSRSLPTLNRAVFRETNLNRLASVASDLGVKLRVENLPGLGIRGFYVNDSAFSGRPLIALNAANPPVSVAAAFWHEIGHHLTHDVFGKSRGRLNLTFSSSYQEHLDDSEEVLADIVMTLGAYPATTAKRLFGARLSNDAGGMIKLVSKASRHVRSVSGFELTDGGPTKKKLHMVAGMIHIAKLRIALLEGYGV